MERLDLTDKWTWVGSILTALIGAAGWVRRRRGKIPGAGPTTSWLSRRLAAERELLSANRTIKTQEAEIAYLMAALGRAQRTQEIVKRAMTASGTISAGSSSGSMASGAGSASDLGANGETGPTYIGPERRQAERRRNWPPQRTS